MKPTRRGFLGIVGGAIAAAVAPIKKAEPSLSGIGAPPWVEGDILQGVRTGLQYRVVSRSEWNRSIQEAFDHGSDSKVFGMRGTGSAVVGTTERPDSWREKILQLYPDRPSPLLEIMRSRKQFTNDREFKIFEKAPSLEPWKVQPGFYDYDDLMLVRLVPNTEPNIWLRDCLDPDGAFIRIGRAYE